MSHDRGCPCGLERYEYNSCKEKNCMKSEVKYVWVKPNGSVEIVGDLIQLFFNPHFDQKTHKIFQLGSRVELEVKIKIAESYR